MEELYKPTVSKKTRDVIYWAGMFSTGLSLLLAGLSVIWFPEYSEKVAGTVLVFASFMGFVSSSTGVVFRPGAQGDLLEP